eukprot:TRINITY_DN17470_c0_g1_i1.p1 TRINITY_DN17470_c0_g1~~TRINITY_DN17470_c0_g1_i1.p1  ORF type:complete len:203 (-),score=15.66 TRINITY_DN17470_c0_g1_i1:104-712(-)
MALQRFFSSCKHTFKGTTTTHVEEVKNTIANLTLEHFDFSKHGVSRVHPTCINVYQSPEFDIALFSIPEGTELPLHSHPHMTVVGRLLTGKADFVSYDLLEPLSRSFFKLHSAKKCQSRIITPENVLEAQPNQENIHSFKALTHCVLLDVLAPPYNFRDRDCIYFRAKTTETEGLQLAVTSPTGYVCNGLPYLGSKPWMQRE